MTHKREKPRVTRCHSFGDIDILFFIFVWILGGTLGIIHFFGLYILVKIQKHQYRWTRLQGSITQHKKIIGPSPCRLFARLWMEKAQRVWRQYLFATEVFERQRQTSLGTKLHICHVHKSHNTVPFRQTFTLVLAGYSIPLRLCSDLC